MRAASAFDGRRLNTDNFLSLTQDNLARVVERLKLLLIESISRRRLHQKFMYEESLRPVSSVSTWSRHPRASSVPRRPLTGAHKPRKFEIHPIDHSDVYASSDNLMKRSVCSPLFLVQTHGRQSPPSNVEQSVLRPTSPAVMNRLSLKLSGKVISRPSSEGRHVQTSSRSKLQQEVLAVDNDEPECEDDMDTIIRKLRVKIREVRVAEERMIRDFHYNPKQLLTQFYDFGNKSKSKPRPTNPNSDPCKELIHLIERVDASLSTNEALAILKEIGIEYQPRSAAGRKNVMATDLSMALAPNGLKLVAQEVTVGPDRKSIVGRETLHAAIRDQDDRSSNDDPALDTNRSSFH